MLAALMTCFVLQAPVGPLDGFRANFASIRAELDFDFQVGEFHENNWRPWDEPLPEFLETRPDDRILGHWACDGRTEYYLVSSPPELLERARKSARRQEGNKASYQVYALPKTEFLWDGETVCWHYDNPHRSTDTRNRHWISVTAEPINDKNQLGNVKGPFFSGLGAFPRELERYRGTVPGRYQLVKSGRPLDVEVYRMSTSVNDGWLQLEVHYDPSVGFLPRFVRSISYDGEDDVAHVMEFFLADARPSASGGFVPYEWYDWYHAVGGFSKKFKNYEYNQDISELPARLGFGHFKARNLKSLDQPVALKELSEVRSISGRGGIVQLERKKPSLTLMDIKSLLGKKLWMPPPSPLPTLNIDTEELHRFDRPAGHSPVAIYLWGGLAALVCLAGWIARKRVGAGKTSVLLIVTWSSACCGCGAARQPVVKVAAQYEEKIVYLEPRTSEMRVRLVLRNDGNVPLHIRKVDGDCTCRKVDQAALPAVVRPGDEIGLTVAMSPPRTSGPQGSAYEIETDEGSLRATAGFVTLVAHAFDPEIVSNTRIVENEPWSFTFTHRVIFDDAEINAAHGLRFPAAFQVASERTESGAVAFARKYQYRDTTYRLTLKESSPGDGRDVIRLVNAAGTTVQEVPVLWKRVPFLGCVPSRVSLGTRPVRVFLQCPDESVELTKVVSSPLGIKAVVSSPREVTVALTDGAPNLIDGWVEVSTTSAPRGSLRFQVVRYAPLAQR